MKPESEGLESREDRPPSEASSAHKDAVKPPEAISTPHSEFFDSATNDEQETHDHLGKIDRDLSGLASAITALSKTDDLERCAGEIKDAVDGIRIQVERVATEDSLTSTLAQWNNWQNAVVDQMEVMAAQSEEAKERFNHGVRQLEHSTTKRYETLLREAERRADHAEDKVLESVIFPLHDAAFRITCDIESGGKVVEGQQATALLEALETNLEQSLGIFVFRPAPGERYRSDCMKPVGQEKTALFFRRPDTVASTVTCGFFRNDAEDESEFFRKAGVVVYRNKRSTVLPGCATEPPKQMTRKTHTGEKT